MGSDQVRALAQAIADYHQQDWSYLLTWAAATFVAGCAGSYIASYLKKRGENYATKKDFESLLQQIRATTEATTAIKTKIEHDDWRLREYISTKRTKAEELVSELSQLDIDLHALGQRVLYEGINNIPLRMAKRPVTLTVLYFPELTSQGMTLQAHSSFMAKILSQFVCDRTAAGNDKDQVERILDVAAKDFMEGMRLNHRISSYIERAVSNELAKISNVQPPYRQTPPPDAELEGFWKEVGPRIDAE